MKMYLKEPEIRVIVAQIIEGLMHIHSKGIIYGDLKAENVLVAKNGTIKLCDFNLSGTQSLLNDTLQGTVCYISPEQIEGQRRTHKSDFWSLGVLCHLLFYRKYPFKDAQGSGILKNILNRNMVKEPRDRKASPEFRKFVEDLLMKDYKRRLGNRIEDFHQHTFFRDFDWANYFDNRSNFDYARNYNISEDEEASDADGVNQSLTLHEDSNTNYKIQGFTYDAKRGGGLTRRAELLEEGPRRELAQQRAPKRRAARLVREKPRRRLHNGAGRLRLEAVELAGPAPGPVPG